MSSLDGFAELQTLGTDAPYTFDIETVGPTKDVEAIAVVTELAGVTPEKVEWLWENRFPLGMLSIVSGDPNSGKSTLLCDLAARVSAGRSWPDSRDKPNPVGAVLMLTAEDDVSRTLVPRILAAGGDVSRIAVIQGIRHPEVEGIDLFNLDRDIRHLDQLLTDRPDVRLVTFDPLDCYLGDVDTHRKSDVQRSLSALGALADRHRAAVLGVLHHRKASADKALYKTLGSLGFVSCPRAVWTVSRQRDNTAVRQFAVVKLNLANDPTGLTFTIEDSDGIGVVHWSDEPLTKTADELMADDGKRSAPQRDDAADWLLSTLAPGAMASKKLQELAERAGYSWSTLKRAKAEIGAKSRQRAGGWYTEIPTEEVF